MIAAYVFGAGEGVPYGLGLVTLKKINNQHTHMLLALCVFYYFVLVFLGSKLICTSLLLSQIPKSFSILLPKNI